MVTGTTNAPKGVFRKSAALVLALAIAAMVSTAFLAGCRRGPRTYTDGLGKTVSLEGTPKRIVSLSPALTEAVFSLGAGDRLVGVSTFCNRPPEALEIEKVGDAFTLNTEKLVSLKPDLVLVAGSRDQESQVEKDLARLGIPAWASGPSTVAEVLQDIEALSKVLGVEKKGEELAAELEEDLEAVRAAFPEGAPRPKVFITFDSELWTSGGGSFIDDVITAAGGANIAGDVDQQYLQLSMEDLLAKDPDVILVAIPEDEAAPLIGRPGWSSLRAVKEGRVFFPNPDLVSRPGPAVVEGIKEIAGWLRGE
ncbi:MAG TPA: cobalamin-binding protein [Firmicutes bacterium]|nr:cobalamin-binding protein [Candidatus Fermentithermobacillaceae bacterium]